MSAPLNIDKYIPDIWMGRYDSRPILPVQIKLYEDWKHRFIWVPAPRRSRKTKILTRKILIKALEKKDLAGHDCEGRYFCAAPTSDQAIGIFWDTLKKETSLFQAKPPRETNHIIYLKNGSVIKVAGLDKSARIEGQTWDGGLITEINDCKSDMWDEHISPCFEDTRGFAYLDGVPNQGMDWYYDKCLYACGGALPDRDEKLMGSFAENGEHAFYHWLTRDVLNPEAIERRRLEMDPLTFAQEWEGQFVSFEGLAYYAFSDKNLMRLRYDPDHIVHIGMDFNVNPMTATFNHFWQGKFYQFGEAFLTNSNTPQMIEHIKSLFPVEMCRIYPDSTGRARKSTSSKSDHVLLRDAGFEILCNSENPRVRDRIAAVNGKLSSMNYLIDPVACPKTVRDYQKVRRTSDGRELDSQKEEGLTHIASAQGYLISYLCPLDEGKVELVP